VARQLVGWAVEGLDRPVVCDPACGGGAFLLEAARHTDRLVAMDIDPLAVAVTEAAVFLATGTRVQPLVVDALQADWPAVDAVVGNPPFLSQLRAATVRDRERAAALGATGYVDESALFLVAAARRARRVALLQPESVVASAGCAPVRDELGPRLARLWVPDRRLFDAAVRVVGVVLDERGGLGGDWASLLADERGVPDVRLEGERLGDRAHVTAGFRDEYYALAAFVQEDVGAPLVTSGLIDPNVLRWGERSARYGKRRWDRPAVAPGAPVDSHLVPKLLVATQTRVIEAVADVAGEWVPCTPVISVVPVDLPLWHALAVLLAPPVTAWAMRRTVGSALSGDAIKLSASQVRDVPLPAAGPSWDAAAAALEAGDLLGAARSMTDAYGVDVLAWWQARLP
jgi:hypothetical protein